MYRERLVDGLHLCVCARTCERVYIITCIHTNTERQRNNVQTTVREKIYLVDKLHLHLYCGYSRDIPTYSFCSLSKFPQFLGTRHYPDISVRFHSRRKLDPLPVGAYQYSFVHKIHLNQ